MRELSSLVSSGSYNQHPSINAVGTDMNYQIAQAMGTSVTYGWLVESVSAQNGLQGGNTQTTILGSNVILGGDIIIAINDAANNQHRRFAVIPRTAYVAGANRKLHSDTERATANVSVTIGKAKLINRVAILKALTDRVDIVAVTRRYFYKPNV